jgi:hypothetical protein
MGFADNDAHRSPNTYPNTILQPNLDRDPDRDGYFDCAQYKYFDAA